MRVSRVLIVLLLLLAVASAAAGCASAPLSVDVDGHLVLLPKVLFSGSQTDIGFTLFAGPELAQGQVQVSLLDSGREVAAAEGRVDGKGTIALRVPALDAGEYQVEVKGPGFEESAAVQVRPGTVVLLETDKPAYQPGQTMRIRTLALDSGLKPAIADIVLEIRDARGYQVLTKTLAPDEFGMASVEFPISTEPDLGEWELTARSGDGTCRVRVRVEESQPPAFDVGVEPARDWFLVREPIQGKVKAAYSFGRPVRGRMTVTASRLGAGWEEYATFAGDIDGAAEFSLDPVVYSVDAAEAGVPGNVRLDVTVIEAATGREQSFTDYVTASEEPLDVRILGDGGAFKPGLPFDVIIQTRTPDGRPVDSLVSVDCIYFDGTGAEVGREPKEVETKRGTVVVRTAPPASAVRAELYASVGTASASRKIAAAYSPSAKFLQVEQFARDPLHSGDAAVFSVYSNTGIQTYFYEVVCRDRVVLSDSSSGDLQFRVTPAMEGTCRLVVYQLLPGGEVVADSMRFSVEGRLPQKVSVSFGQKEASPGSTVDVRLRTEGRAKVALVAEAGSPGSSGVWAGGAGNRLHLETVNAALEQVLDGPVHPAETPGSEGGRAPGALDAFAAAGLVVLSDKQVPEGEANGGNTSPEEEPAGGVVAQASAKSYFPDTWLWEEVVTGADGKATLSYEVPAYLTTWNLHAVSISAEKGLGIAEASLPVSHPFSLSTDLPASAIRGEEISVRVAVANHTGAPQEFEVVVQADPWFQLIGESRKTLLVAANDEGAAEFRISPSGTGTQVLKVTASRGQLAEALNRSIVVEPEGVAAEKVENAVVPAGSGVALDLSVPAPSVAGSARAYLSLSGSAVAQSIEGLDELVKMPIGCGEQNMLSFSPSAHVLTYLDTGRLKTEIRAEAEAMLATGYQRELTHRRDDGAFSVFAGTDGEASLFLTAFVMRSFAQARGVTTIDESVIEEAGEWIAERQKEDGSFESDGPAHHPELISGAQGRDAMTAYVALALLEAGRAQPAAKAVGFLETRLDVMESVYALALSAYALQMADSARAPEAMARLAAVAVEDGDGVHWTGNGLLSPPAADSGTPSRVLPPSAAVDVEATAYALLALLEAGDRETANKAAQWLIGRRNSAGGFESSQDTVVALQALCRYASMTPEPDLTVRISGPGVDRKIRITQDNYMGSQVIEVPAGIGLNVRAEGKGSAVVQGVVSYESTATGDSEAFEVHLSYGAQQVGVDQTVGARLDVAFSPPLEYPGVNAGMVVLEVGIPSGFAVTSDSIDLLREVPSVRRCEQTGNTLVLYLDNMSPGKSSSFPFDLRGLYAARAKPVSARAYSYYTPEWRGETTGVELSVR